MTLSSKMKFTAAAALLAAGVADAQAYGPASMNATNSSSSVPMVDLGYVKYRGGQNATAGINYFRGIQFVPALPSPQTLC